jgi:ribosome-interacting GTPase 1
MAFEDIAFQLVDLPPLSIQHVEPWVFDLVRHADLAWLVVDGHDALCGVEEVRQLLAARRIELVGTERGVTLSEADGMTRRRALLVLTRVDDAQVAAVLDVVDELLDRRWPLLAVSATGGEGLDRLRRQTFEAFDIVRVYTKEPGKPPDRRTPFTLPRGATVGDLAARIHKDLMVTMKFARVWGPSAFDGQAVQKDHLLAEGDVVEIHA